MGPNWNTPTVPLLKPLLDFHKHQDMLKSGIPASLCTRGAQIDTGMQVPRLEEVERCQRRYCKVLSVAHPVVCLNCFLLSILARDSSPKLQPRDWSVSCPLNAGLLNAGYGQEHKVHMSGRLATFTSHAEDDLKRASQPTSIDVESTTTTVQQGARYGRYGYI